MRATILASLLVLGLAAPAFGNILPVYSCPGPFPGSGTNGGSGTTCFDTYNFMAKAGQTYTISTTASYSGDTYLVVSGACTCSNDDYAGLGSQCSCTATYSGQVNICASTFGASAGSWNYTVTGDCAAWPEPTAPELDKIWLLYNYATGDMAPGWCQSKPGYTPAAAFQVYRGSYNWNVGTPWPAHPIYHCIRYPYVVNQDGGNYLKTDEYLWRDSSCGGYGYYQQPMGWALDYQSEGSLNNQALSCWYWAQPQNGGNGWWEIRTEFGFACSSGYAPLSNLGWIRYQSGGTSQTMAGGTCDAAHCMGQCGVNCDGLAGTHYYTSMCQAHDDCVCAHGGNLWDPACYGVFIAAAVSWVVQAAVSLLESIVSAIVHFFESLCFWC